jgi:hypothetical protein
MEFLIELIEHMFDGLLGASGSSKAPTWLRPAIVAALCASASALMGWIAFAAYKDAELWGALLFTAVSAAMAAVCALLCLRIRKSYKK